jgi:hypothetical protein
VPPGRVAASELRFRVVRDRLLRGREDGVEHDSGLVSRGEGWSSTPPGEPVNSALRLTCRVAPYLSMTGRCAAAPISSLVGKLRADSTTLRAQL